MSIQCPPQPSQRSHRISTGRVLVVDDHTKSRESMADILGHADHQVTCCSSGVEALNLASDNSYDVIITDFKMPGMNGVQLLEQLVILDEEIPVILVTAHATIESAVEAMRFGAIDYIEKPFDADQLESVVHRALGQTGRQRPVQALPGESADVTMVGSSLAMQQLRERLVQVAATSETVLISGESGTGKELVALSLHLASGRAARALVSLNCPALSAQLMESELFGHVQGAFTSAESSRIGRFELADGGTMLLDEVTEIDLPLQAKLLRVLQERSFERVGSSETKSVDVRVLATTNRDLHQEVLDGRFREDLYFRLAVVPLNVPPLRERREDIDALATHFLTSTAARLGRCPQVLSSSARDLLQNYHWPGNVRELENIVTRAGVLDTASRIEADPLRDWLIDADGCSPSEMHRDDVPVGLSLEEMERKMIIATLDHYDGHRARTAKALGIGVRTLSGKLRAFGYAPRAKKRNEAA